MTKLAHITVDAVIQRVRSAPKYRAIHPDTISDVVRQESLHAAGKADLERRVRLKLHRVAAGYLFTARPTHLLRALDSLPSDEEGLRTFCRTVLAAHFSSAERLPDLERFYPTVFAATGLASVVADLACAVNPFSLPWLRDVSEARYVGYDLNLSYVDLDRRFLAQRYPDCAVQYRDVLVDPAAIAGDVALLLKTYHSIEERRTGAGLRLVAELGTRTVVVSFPVKTMQGRRAPSWQVQIGQLESLAGKRGWNFDRVALPTEDLIVVRKDGGHAPPG
jgi:16S rRNA (guanine(1405)-N(7))-methyltransferase